MKKIVVIGSANMDTTNRVEEFPDVLTSESLNDIKETTRVLGGKGANQAVSAAKQTQGTDTKVYFIGCVGKDEAGISVLEGFKNQGVDYSQVRVVDADTDGRMIYVEEKTGKNIMFGYGDCVKQLTPEVVFNEETIKILQDADVVIIQMKMPDETIEEIIDYCDEHMITLMIDPTPIEKSSLLISKNLLDKATYLTPNEEEAIALAMYEQGFTLEQIKERIDAIPREKKLEIIKDLVQRHQNLIVTLGDEGVMYYNRGVKHHQAYPTECIDSTGAGDTFNGTFAAAIIRGEDLDTAIEYALINCANKVRFVGAQNGMQTIEETKRDYDRIQTR